MLKDILPAAKRKKAYAYFALLGVVLAAATAGFAVVGAVPTALVVADAVYASLGGAFGVTARANVAPEKP